MHEHDDETTRVPGTLADIPPFPVTARRRAPGEPLRLRRTSSFGTLEERLARLDEALDPPSERPVPRSGVDSATT